MPKWIVRRPVNQSAQVALTSMDSVDISGQLPTTSRIRDWTALLGSEKNWSAAAKSRACIARKKRFATTVGGVTHQQAVAASAVRMRSVRREKRGRMVTEPGFLPMRFEWLGFCD